MCLTAGCGKTSQTSGNEAVESGTSQEAGRLDNFNLDGTLPIVKDPSKMEPIKIAVVIGADSSVPTKDKEMTKKIAEETGIPIEWQEIPADGSAEKINLMLTSGEYPDVFWNGISSDMAVQYSDQDVFVPTEDLIDQYAPKLAQIFKDHPQYKQGSTTPNGHSYGFPYIEEMHGLVLTPGPFMINQAWLDKGKQMPATIDEFVDCMRAFKEAGDLNGNGKADEIPYALEFGNADGFGSFDSFYYFTGAFGMADSICSGNATANHLRLIDGKIIFAATDDAFRKTCDFFHDMYTDGLIDPDSFAPSGTGTPLYINKLAQPEAVIGAFQCWTPRDNIVDLDVREEYVPLPRLTGPEGKCGNVLNYSEMQDTSMVAVTDKCEYPEVVAALVNYCMDPEISITLNWGAIGYTYVKGDDGVLHFNLDENDNIILQNGWQYFSEQRTNTSPTRGSLAVLNEYYDKYVDYTWDAVPILEGQRVNGKEECLEEIPAIPKMMLSLEENNKLSQIYGTINNIVNAYQMDAVMNGTDDAGWDKFKQDLKAAGMEELVNIYQGAYDRYCSFGE
jgi:putative aldouronate transport system substrate-binding protein